MDVIEFDRWKPSADDPRKLEYDGQRTAEDVFEQLKFRLDGQGYLPDEYFELRGEWEGGREIPRDADLFCTVDYGASEGVYVDVYLKWYDEKQKKSVTESFITGKTLGENGNDMDRMFLTASAITKAVHGDHATHARYMQVGGPKEDTGGRVVHLSQQEEKVIIDALVEQRERQEEAMGQTEQLLRRMTGSITAYMDTVGHRPLRLSDYDKAVLAVRDGEMSAFKELCPKALRDHKNGLLIEAAGRPSDVGGRMMPEDAPEIMMEAMTIGWTQNAVILEAELALQERAWYIRAVRQFGWSKLKLAEKIAVSAHLEMALDLTAELCYNEENSATECINDDEPPFYLPRQHMSKPMAEFVMKDLVKMSGLEAQFHIESAATSTEEIGNSVCPPARRKLSEYGISCEGKTARQLINADYDRFDLLIGMDQANLRNMHRICGGDYDGKLHLLMDYTDRREGAPAKPPSRLCGERSRSGMSELSALAGSEGYGACGDDVADPWYTGDFEATWRDVLAGCQGLLRELSQK